MHFAAPLCSSLSCLSIPCPFFLISHSDRWWMTATGFPGQLGSRCELFPWCRSPFCSCVEDTAGFSFRSAIKFTHQSHPRPPSSSRSVSYTASISSACKCSPAYGKVSCLFFSLSFFLSTFYHSSISLLHWRSDSHILSCKHFFPQLLQLSKVFCQNSFWFLSSSFSSSELCYVVSVSRFLSNHSNRISS